jgi:HAD superfamily hydrolase (TIGR01484 family)
MKILFSDYDGTLYTGGDSVAKNIKAIEAFRTAGHKFVIATGRSLGSIKRVLAEHPIPYDYLILNNGSLVTNDKDDLLLKETLSPELAKKIAAFAEEKAETSIEILYYDLIDKADSPDQDLTKLRVRTAGKSHAPAEHLSEKLNKYFGDKTISHPVFNDLYPEIDYNLVDTVNKSAGKDNAINFILHRESLSKSDATSVGDGPNDLDMLRHFNGYALKNSDSSVLKEITKTTSSVADLISNMLQ